MRYNPKAKLNVRQIRDLRTDGPIRRRNATGTDGAERIPSQEEAFSDEIYRRYHQIMYTRAYQPVGHNRVLSVGRDSRGRLDLIPAKPDGADMVQKPKKPKKRLKVRRAGPRPARG